MRGWCALGLILAACEMPMPVVAEGEHVTVRSDVPWCDETTGWLDESIVLLADWLGIEPPHVTWNRHGTAENAASACGESPRLGPVSVTGCTNGNDVEISTDADGHEIVHGVASSLGDPPGWLREGLAEAIGSEPVLEDIVPIEPDYLSAALESDDVLTNDPLYLHYSQAALFVRYLLRVLGRDAVLAMYRELDRGAGRAGLASYLRAELDVDLDALLDDWSRMDTQIFTQVIEPVVACTGPPLEDGAPIAMRPGVHVLAHWTIPLRARGAVRRLPAPETGWSSLRLASGDCRSSSFGIHLCGATLGVEGGWPAVADVPAGETLNMVYQSPESGYATAVLPNSEDFFDESLDCGEPCAVEMAHDTLEVDACGAVRVRFDGEPIRFVNLAPYFTVEADGPFTVVLTSPNTYSNACRLDGPCGAPVECSEELGGIPWRVTADRTLYLTLSTPGVIDLRASD